MGGGPAGEEPVVDFPHLTEEALTAESIGGSGEGGTVDSACNATVAGDAWANRFLELVEAKGLMRFVYDTPAICAFRFGNG